MAPPIYLVACVSQKLDRRAPAAELYRSDWFRKARTYVEETGERWYVLSAAHGLVEPAKRLSPYDVTLRDLTAAERRLWGKKTVRQLRRAIGPRYAGPIVFLAGRLYCEPLLAFVNRRPKRTPYRRPKGTPFVERCDGYGGRAVRAGCGVGRA
nr:DUF6884 domain-containing protein [Sphingomonas sp. CROZ-RG-20F-R02-07]